MSQVVIHCEQLGKRYRIGQRQPYLALRDVLADAAKATLRPFRASAPASANNRARHIWALKDVSFDVREGEVVGIIGRNGAGKSTLLKVLARVTNPTEGFATVHGRLGSLLEVGTGFHSELTGRENTYLSGAILGMGKREIARKFDEIVAFAEVEKFIDTPLKHYSTGMQMRLAFAVAAHLEPEILLVDEVLAVGDLEFQKKCMGKMSVVAKQGRTILFVSHNMGAITRLCQRALWIDRGKIFQEGPSNTVVSRYQLHCLTPRAEWMRFPEEVPQTDLAFLGVAITGPTAGRTSLFGGDEPISVEIRYVVRRSFSGCQIGIRTYNADGVVVFTTTDADGTGAPALPKESGCYRTGFTIPGGFLAPGTYHMLVAAHLPHRRAYDLVEQAVVFEVSTTGSLASIDGRLGVVTPLFIWWTGKEVLNADKDASYSAPSSFRQVVLPPSL